MTEYKIMSIGNRIVCHTELQKQILNLLKKFGAMDRDQITKAVYDENRVPRTKRLRFRTTVYDAIKPMILSNEVYKFPLRKGTRGRPRVMFALVGDK